MNHVKLFESFVDDFKSDLEQAKKLYQDEIDKISKSIKSEVDGVMFELTDEYQYGDRSKIEVYKNDLFFLIYYENIKFNLSKSDDFLKILDGVSKKIRNEMDLNIIFDAYLGYGQETEDNEKILVENFDGDDLEELKRKIRHLKRKMERNGTISEARLYNIRIPNLIIRC
jgi:ribosomal protein S17E